MTAAPTSLAERLRRRMILERDAAQLRRRLGRPTLRSDNGATVLFASLTEFVYQLKLEGILATALAADGWRPVILTPPRSWIPRRYFAAFGIDQLVSLDEYLDEDTRSSAQEDAASILGECRTAADLRALTYRGAAIGRHLLSTISRATHDGRVDPDAPAARAALERLLPRTLASTRAAERLLADLDPRLVLFLERNYAAEAPLSDLALERDTHVVQYVSGPQDDSLVFKRFTSNTRREHPRSLSRESWDVVRTMPWTPERDCELDEELSRRYDRSWALGRRLQSWTRDQPEHDVLARLGLDPERKTAVVYSHVLWD